MFELRLLEARKKKGFTQKQVAEKAEIHVASYSAYENNHKIPPVDILLRIANVLEVSLDWLCGQGAELPRVNSYGDIARSIVSLMQKMGQSCVVKAQRNENGYTYTEITLWDSVIHSFFAKACKFDEMSKGSDDERELYFTWLEKKLAELDFEPIELEFEDAFPEDLPY